MFENTIWKDKAVIGYNDIIMKQKKGVMKNGRKKQQLNCFFDYFDMVTQCGNNYTFIQRQF